MNVHQFRPGDRVQQKTGGPVMEVMGYVIEHKNMISDDSTDHEVICVWYDDHHVRHEEVYDQRTLWRVEDLLV